MSQSCQIQNIQEIIDKEKQNAFVEQSLSQENKNIPNQENNQRHPNQSSQITQKLQNTYLNDASQPLKNIEIEEIQKFHINQAINMQKLANQNETFHKFNHQNIQQQDLKLNQLQKDSEQSVLKDQSRQKMEQTKQNIPKEEKKDDQQNPLKQISYDFKPSINYMTPLQAGLNQMQRMMFNTQKINTLQSQSTQIQTQLNSTDLKNIPRRKWYLNPDDWQLDVKKGGLIFINQQKKKNQSKVLKFILKKFLSTGSFMGISFPTFAMKPETILQSYAKAIGAAPLLFLQNVTNPVQRLKKFICFIHTFSVLFSDMQKPYNPPLGQTFQAIIANGLYSAEQICHHPPISAFYFQGKGYKIYGSMQLTANIGPNSAKGLFLGDLTLQFADGHLLKGKVPGGQFSGFVIGENKLQTFGSMYAYDNRKLIFSGLTPKKNNFFQGLIGKLKPKYQQEFFTKIKSVQRFQKFPFYERKCFDTVYSFMQMTYNSKTVFDGKQYLNLNDQKYFPFEYQNILDEKILLKSDSRFRKDIPLRKQFKYDQSQQQKQKIEDQERYFRKLRQKFDPSHHKNH